MPRSLFKLKDYEVHAITSFDGITSNVNLVTWLMQTDMSKKMLAVALYKPDLTLEIVRSSGFAKYVNLIGRKSGRDVTKLQYTNHKADYRGCPILLDAVGCLHTVVVDWADAGDHFLAICKVEKETVLNPEKGILRLGYLREKKLVRG